MSLRRHRRNRDSSSRCISQRRGNDDPTAEWQSGGRRMDGQYLIHTNPTTIAMPCCVRSLHTTLSTLDDLVHICSFRIDLIFPMKYDPWICESSECQCSKNKKKQSNVSIGHISGDVLRDEDKEEDSWEDNGCESPTKTSPIWSNEQLQGEV